MAKNQRRKSVQQISHTFEKLNSCQGDEVKAQCFVLPYLDEKFVQLDILYRRIHRVGKNGKTCRNANNIDWMDYG